MIIFAFITILIIMVIAHFLYEILNDHYMINDDRYVINDDRYVINDDRYVINANCNNKEGFYGDRPFRDANYGSYDDPNNKEGKLGNEKTSRTIENIKKIKKMINNVFKASSKLDDSANVNEQRSGDQIFIFHDELEGVKNTNNNKYNGRIWNTSDFLSRMERDGYSYNIQGKNDYWNKKLIFPDEKL